MYKRQPIQYFYYTMLDGAVFFAIIEEENEVIWMVQDRNPEYFLAIASEKSISKAAERLHISQPYLRCV